MPTKTKTKEVKKKAGLTTNTSQKQRGGNKNPTGKGGFGERPQDRNNNGQRKREVVATASQARDLYVKVLHEPINTKPDPEMSNLELIVRQHVREAKSGDPDARETMFNRIWGKAMEKVDHTSSDGSMTPPTAIQFVPYVKPDTDNP